MKTSWSRLGAVVAVAAPAAAADAACVAAAAALGRSWTAPGPLLGGYGLPKLPKPRIERSREGSRHDPPVSTLYCMRLHEILFYLY